MNVRTRITAVAAAAAMVSVFGLSGTAASAAPSAPVSTVAAAQAVDLPVVGTLPDGTVFNGQLSGLTTSLVNGVPTLAGMITGTGLAAPTTFVAPITGVMAACQVLTLNLGPLNLNVIGVIVDLQPVNLLVAAVPTNIVTALVCALLGNAAVVPVAVAQIVPLLTEVLPVLGLAPITVPAPL
jgi:hypothetical protein